MTHGDQPLMTEAIVVGIRSQVHNTSLNRSTENKNDATLEASAPMHLTGNACISILRRSRGAYLILGARRP